MTVRVRLCAWLRDAAGTEECWLTLSPGARGVEARAALADRYVQLRGLVDHVRLAINEEYHAWERPLSDGDELALIPPVSGG